MIIDVERAGDSILLTFDGLTVMLDRADAQQLGLAVLQVSTLGADTLDEPVESRDE